jgi:hypothetical protein
MGEMLTGMLVTMSDRGPDSAGVAIYGAGRRGAAKLTVQAGCARRRLRDTGRDAVARIGAPVRLTRNDTHAVLHLDADACQPPAPRCARWRASDHERRRPDRDLQGGGPAPRRRRPVRLPAMSGTHGIGHTRMATESAVTTEGAHPFSTGADQCLVHNGSLPITTRCAKAAPRRRAHRKRERHRGRRGLPDVEDAAGRDAGRGAGKRAHRSRRVLHLRRGHQGRLRRGARPRSPASPP